MRLTIAVLALASACPSSGQFGRLATTDDGSVVYFDAAFRRKGTEEPAQGRIWKIATVPGSRPELVVERRQSAPGYWLSAPEVSSDGRTLAFTAHGRCDADPQTCFSFELYSVTVAPSESPDKPVFTTSGFGRLSRNAQFLLNSGSLGVSRVQLRDLKTGRSTSILNRTPVQSRGHIVADDGSVLLTGADGLWLRRASGDLTRIERRNIIRSPGAATIDARASTVAYLLSEEDRRELHVFDVQSGSDRIFVSVDGEARLVDPLLSADGSILIFASNAQIGTTNPAAEFQLFAVRSDGTGFRRVTAHPQGVRTAALSGDGRVIWYLSGNNTFHRVEVESGVDSQMLGRTPEIAEFSAGAAGSQVSMSGWGLAGSSGTHAIAVTIAGFAAPVLAASPNEIRLQIPWELAVNSYTRTPASVVTSSADDTPFEQSPDQAIDLWPIAPQFARTPGNALVAVHEDWSGLVSVMSRAQPGEIVHLYGTGFGPVDPPQRTGFAAVSDPPASLTSLPNCGETPVVFAGLAPGFIGLYQISVRLPSGSPAGVVCRWPDRVEAADGFIP